jgi:hypothetical protein
LQTLINTFPPERDAQLGRLEDNQEQPSFMEKVALLGERDAKMLEVAPNVSRQYEE